jgi:hypothetical protein
MIDEHKLIRDASRTSEADGLLNNALFQEALKEVETQLIQAWKNTKPRDVEGREGAWAAIQQLGNLQGYIRSVLDDGKIAQRQLNDLQAGR